MKKFITPFGELSSPQKWISLLMGILLVWTLLPNSKFPPLHEILLAFPKLLSKNDLVGNFLTSIFFCFKCMGYATLIAFLFFGIAQIPLFKEFAALCRKFRFLPSVGLSFLFMRMTGEVGVQMTWIMVFGITTYLIDAGVGIALSITQDEVNYTKSLRLNAWQALRELVIYGKLADFFQIVIQNFAIAWFLLATVENICKSSGGIGVVISESAKYFRLEEVFAIQILILLTGLGLDYSLNKLKDFLFPYTTL